MAHNILLTGASGYLGGSLLALFTKSPLPPYNKLFILVRTSNQAESIRQYHATPLLLDPGSPEQLAAAVIEHEINIVFWLIDVSRAEKQISVIQALGHVRRATGREGHFLQTGGCKQFSDMAGFPGRVVLDTDEDVFGLQRESRAEFGVLGTSIQVNNTVIDTADAHGVRSYIFVPCIVYGPGEGFGNKISIQVVAIIKAAKALRRVYRPHEGNPTWPVCHIIDNTTLYLQLLRSILSGEDIGYGKKGYYLAATGSVAWNDLYQAFATALAKRNIVDDEQVVFTANDNILEQMGKAIGCPKELVKLQLSGTSTFTAAHGKKIGWKPEYPAEHIIEIADAEVEFVLKHLEN